MSVPTAQAIPAFARKHDLNCAVCHTAPPRLNTYGERFLENGYQLPGTEDGGITKKKKLGDLNLDDVANYTGVRLRGNVLRNYSFKQQNPLAAEAGVVQNKVELGFPEVFSLFTAGTLTRNVGFFAELESNLEEHATGIERAFLTFNNIGGGECRQHTGWKTRPLCSLLLFNAPPAVRACRREDTFDDTRRSASGTLSTCVSSKILRPPRSFRRCPLPLCPVALQRRGRDRRRGARTSLRGLVHVSGGRAQRSE